MDLRTYVQVLRKRWWLIALCALLGLGGAVAYNKVAPREYASTVSFYVSTPTEASGGNAFQANQYALSKIKSYAALLTSDRLAKMVLDDTELPLTPSQIAGKVSATSELDTVVLTATVVDSAPQRSLAIARSISTQFGSLVSELDNFTVKGGASGSTVQLNVTSGPTLQSAPISPRVNLNLALGLAAGLLVGVLLAFLRELFDTSVRSVEVLRRIVGQPVLATIRLDKAARHQAVAAGVGGSSRAEAYRQLRTNLRFIDLATPLQVIAVTSAVPSEGKSSTAINLAQVFAQAGDRVVLVEADLRRPAVAGYLGAEGRVGLTNVLVGQVDLDEALQPGGDGEFSLLPSGTVPPNPSELLGTTMMSDLLGRLREQFDMVIVDTPPVLPVADASVVAQFVDGTILVVRHGRTSRSQVASAIETLRTVDATVIGSVLNAVHERQFLGKRPQDYDYYTASAEAATRRGRQSGRSQATSNGRKQVTSGRK